MSGNGAPPLPVAYAAVVGTHVGLAGLAPHLDGLAAALALEGVARLKGDLPDGGLAAPVAEAAKNCLRLRAHDTPTVVGSSRSAQRT